MGNICGSSWCPLSSYASARSDEANDTAESRLASEVRAETTELTNQLDELTKERQRNFGALQNAVKRRKGGDASAAAEIAAIASQIEAGTVSINSISKQVADCRRSLHVYATRTVIKRNNKVSDKVRRLLDKLNSRENRDLVDRTERTHDAVEDHLDGCDEDIARMVPDEESEPPETQAERALDRVLGYATADARDTNDDELLAKIGKAMGIPHATGGVVYPAAPTGAVGKRDAPDTTERLGVLSAPSDDDNEDDRTNQDSHRRLLASV
jgi:hypothetical protein